MLQPDPNKPGVWTNSAWTPGTPGTFALIIGSSRYPNLDGSQRTFGMSSLFVSALTAQRFFEWLSSRYSLTGCPLATCRLLLAPTAAERTFPGPVSGPLLDPTFNNVDQAISEWYGDMAVLPQAAAQQSRSVFFFSGHGLEIMEDRQILLPSDYLRPGSPLDRAISTQNIARGLKALAVPLHFLFVDACRNDHNNLGSVAPLEGTRILNEPSNRAVNQDAFVPIFYGSTAGSQAFQPDDPTRGLSLFGDALLEGLLAKGLTPDCSSGPCRIVLQSLRPFVNRRVQEIARTKFGEETAQRVRVRGDQTEEPVTEVPRPVMRVAPAPQAPPPARPNPESTQAFRVEPPAPPAPGSPAPAPSAPAPMAPGAIRAFRPTTSTFSEVHDIFGSEDVTRIWRETARVRELGSPVWLAAGQDLELRDVKRTSTTSSFSLDLNIPSARPGRTYWLELSDAVQTFGCILAVDADSYQTTFRFEMDFQFNPRTFQRLDVTLSENNGAFLGTAARLWRAYDERSAAVAIREQLPLAHLEGLLQSKGSSKLGAAVAGLVLLRARAWDRLHDWLGNLARLAPELPDARILWAEQCLHDPAQYNPDQALHQLLTLSQTPLPFFAESLGYALRQVEDLLRQPSPAAGEITNVHRRLSAAVNRLRPGGLFATFAGTSSEIDRLVG